MWKTATAVVTSIALVVGAPGASAAAPSGIRGTVTRSPTKPVCEEGVPCTAPAVGLVLVVARNGSIVARATTARDGSFRVALGPGVYVVRTRNVMRIGGFRPVTVRVLRGRFTPLKLTVDTGIR